MKYSLFFFLGSLFSPAIAYVSPDYRLVMARDVARDVVRADRFCPHVKELPGYGHYRAALALLEQGHCVGAYASRCKRMKEELLHEEILPLTERDFAGNVQALSHLAVGAALITSEDSQSEDVGQLKRVLEPFAKEIAAIDPAQYAAIQEAYGARKSGATPEEWLSLKNSLYHACLKSFGIGNAGDTEEAVAAAEVRLREKKK